MTDQRERWEEIRDEIGATDERPTDAGTERQALALATVFFSCFERACKHAAEVENERDEAVSNFSEAADWMRLLGRQLEEGSQQRDDLRTQLAEARREVLLAVADELCRRIDGYDRDTQPWQRQALNYAERHFRQLAEEVTP